MTNREMLVAVLTDTSPFDDGGAHDESVIFYNISCPYYYGEGECHDDDNLVNDWETCVRCKTKWLDSEVEK